MPWHADTEHKSDEGVRSEAKVQVTEDIREWDYGAYEGLTSHQVGLFCGFSWVGDEGVERGRDWIG